ncbi:MAG: DNA polymerase IV [Nitrososphaerota archaeon]|nr:DNA polymerase IV [Nitrososphaerota archaeon]MDG6903770.1 DNA polymerase IV [Nitrososphaerota archaeon]MDG6911597.1 DNA polymerase IV [Nitrososphaerota archaeon]MDG6940501.1 DNA polymerase IV [Nitrososphaerota archaeon]MDG6960812.1 DNA polymerase IV [Nitrososphaerota archaeon]
MVRVVGHIDFDYFYAQVEEVENPALKSRPVIVCVFSGRTEDSGVVSTANYKARELGVRSGMPIALAKKALDGMDAAVIKMDHEKYETVSGRIMEELEGRVDILEPTSIDEAFFDITSSTGGDYSRAVDAANSIKGAIFAREHLTSSIGLGRSRTVAKLGSDIAKPNGLKAVYPEETESFLASMPVAKLYGVGPKTSATLDSMGIRTAGELAMVQPAELERAFGRKLSAYLLGAATGTDPDPVVAGAPPTQFSRIITLSRDTRDPQEAFNQLSKGVEYVHRKLITSGKMFRTVTAIGILTDLSTKTKSRSFEAPSDDAMALRDVTFSLFQELSSSVTRDFRRVGIRVSGLSTVDNQSSLSQFFQAGG